jgi:cephalosporin-C deacetylase-like acetyl esterase
MNEPKPARQPTARPHVPSDHVFLPYVEPEELAGPVLNDPLSFDTQILEQGDEGGVRWSELCFLSEVYRGSPIFMHAWLCHPVQTEAPGKEKAHQFPALLAIPGGRGVTEKELPIWLSKTCGVMSLGVDWIGAGKSSGVPGLDPWSNAIRFDGDDYRDSFQFRNLRALLRATNFLLSQPAADPSQLMAMGGSWGGFYSWLLAGLDNRFRHIFPTFGCGFLDTEARQVWESDFVSMGPAKAEMWLRAFDPGRRAHLIRASVFYQQATNDKFYSLLAAMKTYHRVKTPKSLLLVHNQDHFTFPYNAQDVQRLQYFLGRDGSQPAPVIHDASWLHGTSTVEIQAEDEENLELSVIYSFGKYTKSFGRCWRTAPARRSDDGRWLAEIPVVDVDREVWFYGHAERPDRSSAASTPVKSVIPRQSGLRTATAEFNPRFDFAGQDFWRLPIGDRQHPAMRLVTEDGVTGLAMKFTGDPSRRGIVYCLEGDLIATHRLNAIEVHVKVPNGDHLAGLSLVLVTDFHSISEQTYVARLEDYGRDFRAYRCLQIPFADFRVCPHRRYLAWQPPLRPLDVSRLCGVGFFHADQAYRGEAVLAQLRALRMSGAPDMPPARATPPPWPLREAVLNEPDSLAATGQEVVTRVERAVAATVEGPAAAPTVPPSPTLSTVTELGDGRPPTEEATESDLYLATGMPAEELRKELRRLQPWRYEIIFANGVRTSEFPAAAHFTRFPLAKWDVFAKVIPAECIGEGKALDVGSNIGHHAFNLRRKYGMSVLGIDDNARNVEIAEFLARVSGLDRIRFLRADANHYRGDESFDLVVHFGTLDHLKHPLLALENTATMLRQDGFLALELQTYKSGDDETICKFIEGDFRGDNTCWWFPGKDAVIGMLRHCGFDRIDVLHEWSSPERIGADMRRLRLLARKR